jgi:hypothetical protein
MAQVLASDVVYYFFGSNWQLHAKWATRKVGYTRLSMHKVGYKWLTVYLNVGYAQPFPLHQLCQIPLKKSNLLIKYTF